MTTFDNLEFSEHPNHPGGVISGIRFDNGYGASVIRSSYSYGGEDGLYELAVTKDGRLCYNTPITSDVEGHLSESAVSALLGQIEALPKVEAA